MEEICSGTDLDAGQKTENAPFLFVLLNGFSFGVIRSEHIFNVSFIVLSVAPNIKNNQKLFFLKISWLVHFIHFL